MKIFSCLADRVSSLRASAVRRSYYSRVAGNWRIRMNTRHQRGYLRCAPRKNGPFVWEFLWRENGANGKRLRRTAVIGTVEQYPTEELALVAVNGLRVSINEACNRQRQRFILFGDLVDHYQGQRLTSAMCGPSSLKTG